MTPEANPKTKSTLDDIGREIGHAARKLEEEGEKMIAYLNREVVPAIRTNSSKALRVASDKLAKLAEYMERNTKPK
ncbi:MAG TPA: hypothetical protein VHA33_00500 [Candidatus Angelobacter sp.]|jgi:hypothetical protein|nr:hypothetical protein [Candidatus Angelobacter sp.]